MVAAACLVHDIGNPPFGHAGEQAIRHWFQHTERHTGLKPEYLLDVRYFEGNAQGFRILTRLQAWHNQGGLRLTCATLGAFQKYPMGSMGKDFKIDQTDYHREKFGFFQDDRTAMKKVAEALKLIPIENEPFAWYRHPLAILVEAADDICNSIADVEDGFKYKKISYDHVYDLLKKIATKSGWKKPLNPQMSKYDRKRGKNYTTDEKIAYLRAEAIGALVWQAIQAYKKNENRIMKGKFHDSLMQHVGCCTDLEEIEKVCKTHLFDDESTVRAELAGFEVILGLLEIFTDALWAWQEVGYDDERLSSRDKKVLGLLKKSFPVPQNHYQWLLCINDYVSGMTDTFAVELFRRLKGISIGGGIR